MVQECLHCVDLRREIDSLKKKIISLSPLKGDDKISISRDDDVWCIVDHKKDKDSLIVSENKHFVSHSDVLFIKKLLFDDFFVKEKFVIRGKKELIPAIILRKNLFMSANEFWASRSKFYFRLYYYPIKVLEYLGVIHFSGGGIITLNKKYFVGDFDGS